MNVFCKNLKRLRLAKKLTQEQAAEKLGVSAQSISRWECGTTLPDVTVLPQIARLYCVTIDDLYRETSTAYENYASRLGSVFEATKDPEDFLSAELEYRKLLSSGEYTAEDLRLYGILHQYMMGVCMEKAEALFDRVLKMGPEQEPDIYWRVRRQKGYFLWQVGRNRETIEECLPAVEAGTGEIQEWICLIAAYQMAEEYEKALELAQKAEKKFPESAYLHIYTGDLYRSLKRYEEAFRHWRRALEMEPEWLDSAYSMGFAYEELEDYENAARVWEGIANHLAGRGYDVEANWPMELAGKCREKLKRK